MFERGAKLRLIILSRNSLAEVLNFRLAYQRVEVHGAKQASVRNPSI